jgi:hypothetical protein
MPKQSKPLTTSRPVSVSTEEPKKCPVGQFCNFNGALIGGSSRENLTYQDCQYFSPLLPGVQALNDTICVEKKCFHQKNWVIFSRKSCKKLMHNAYEVSL